MESHEESVFRSFVPAPDALTADGYLPEGRGEMGIGHR